jgi:hypothetical protein
MSDAFPDAPAGAALLAVARQSLLDEVAPALSGRQRYVLLMAANAMGLVMREIAQAGAATEAWERALDGAGTPADLVEAIRAGRHDGDAALRDSDPGAPIRASVGAAGAPAPVVAAPEIGDELRHDEGRQELAQHRRSLRQRALRTSQPAAKARAARPSRVLVRLASAVRIACRP